MMPLDFVIVCEAQADFQTASTLADRVLCERVDWIEAQILNAYRNYIGTRPETPYLTWTESAQLSKVLGRRVHGHFEGKPGDLDALAGRKAILVVLLKFPQVKAILLIRDSDGLVARQKGLNQARAEMKTFENLAIVVGVAHCKREAWILAGFDSRDEEERRQLEALRQELGFDPCERAHDLDAKHVHDKRSAKRALSLLVGNKPDREADCIAKPSLALLTLRGQDNGLATYIREVNDFIVPLFAD